MENILQILFLKKGDSMATNINFNNHVRELNRTMRGMQHFLYFTAYSAGNNWIKSGQALHLWLVAFCRVRRS